MSNRRPGNNRLIIRQTTAQIRAPDHHILAHVYPLPLVRAYVRRVTEHAANTSNHQSHNHQEVPSK